MANKTKEEITFKDDNKKLVIVDPNLASFEGHPFFEEKADTAQKLFSRVGLPNDLNKKHIRIIFI